MASSSNQSSDIIGTASITWTVDNFSDKPNSVIWSPCFQPSKKNHISFELLMLPSSSDPCFKDYLVVYLWHNKGEKILNLEYDVSILKNDGEKAYTKKMYWNYDEDSLNDSAFDAINLISKSKLTANGFVQNNKLILRCDVIMFESKISPHNRGILENTMAIVLGNNQSLLESGKHSDVVLQIGKKEIHAHKTILAAQSPVFSAMFEHLETKEAQQGRVEIIDIGSDAFEELLRYIYSGTMPDLDKYALELFVAADKYQLDHLKSICEKRLGTSLSVDSVASVLQLADLHQAEGLKSKCVSFITANSAKVLASEGWKKLRKCRLELVSEMLENIIISVTSKK